MCEVWHGLPKCECPDAFVVMPSWLLLHGGGANLPCMHGTGDRARVENLLGRANLFADAGSLFGNASMNLQ
jgi:hypothetical protein